MKKLLVFTVFLIAGYFITAKAATLTIINKYPNTLAFHIDQGQNFIPEMPTNIVLSSGGRTPAYEVLSSLVQCEPQSASTFIDFHSIVVPGKIPDGGYIGTGESCVTNSQQQPNVIINPEEGRGVDYTYQNGENATITICSADDFYHNHGHCN